MTGIAGFDELSHGGLPPQCWVNAVRERNEHGLFVAFEESTRQIVADAATFDWGLAPLMKKKVFFLDALLSPEVVHSGEFDLSGVLAMLKAKKDESVPHGSCSTGIDVLLTLLPTLYAYAKLAQARQTAACNHFHRVRADQFHLTHEFLADMLGVCRAGVSGAAELRAAACACYEIVSKAGGLVP